MGDTIARTTAADVIRLLEIGTVDAAHSAWASMEPGADAADVEAVAAAFEAAGLAADAEAVFRAGAERMAGDYWLFEKYAAFVRNLGRPHDALALYAVGQARFPDAGIMYLSEGNLRLDIGDWQGAERAFAAGRRVSPDWLWPAVGWARAAEASGDLAQALHRWRAVRTRFPSDGISHIGYAEALRACGLTGEAAEAVRLAVAQFPDDALVRDLHDRIGGPPAPGSDSSFDARTYRAPADFHLSPTPLRRAIVIGSCFAEAWSHMFARGNPPCPTDFYLFNNAGALPERPARPVADYDFAAIHLPLRSILPDGAYMSLPFETAAYEALLAECCDRIALFLRSAMRWNISDGLLAFVGNFFVPQQNPMGRLLPRCDLRNLRFFVEELNRFLAREVATYGNAYILDLDELVSTYGRVHFQDDAVINVNHAAILGDFMWEADQARLEPTQRMAASYPIDLHHIGEPLWAELVAMYRTVRQVDMVKVVIVDIDDTLWRGVAADDSVSAVERIEGWPMGMIEALGFLKRRGVLLALVSKNEEPTIERIWPSIIPNERLALADFAVRRINWRPKADNIAEILELLNLLPRSALFVDDNPVERAAVQSAFPDIRVIGPNPYVWRRLLLWAPETQVATITAESAKRTEMVQGQVERETKRKVLPRAEFLMSLKLAVAVRRIARADDPGFKRALELINKTNQFNTTGKRWTEQEFAALFGAGGYLIATRAKDKFSDYGIIGVMIVAQARVVQFVMSCRVVGLDVEIATIGHALRLMADAGEVQARADLVETDANLLSRDLWPRSGFAPDGAGWTRPLHEALPLPAHVTLVIEDVPAVAVA